MSPLKMSAHAKGGQFNGLKAECVHRLHRLQPHGGGGGAERVELETDLDLETIYVSAQRGPNKY